MTKLFTLTIETGNAAFHDDEPDLTDLGDRDTWITCVELARILREVADRLEQDVTDGSCRDLNGNTVGGWELR